MPASVGVRELFQMQLEETWPTKAKGLPTTVEPSFLIVSVFTLTHYNNRGSNVLLTWDVINIQVRAIKCKDLNEEASEQQIDQFEKMALHSPIFL